MSNVIRVLGAMFVLFGFGLAYGQDSMELEPVTCKVSVRRTDGSSREPMFEVFAEISSQKISQCSFVHDRPLLTVVKRLDYREDIRRRKFGVNATVDLGQDERSMVFSIWRHETPAWTEKRLVIVQFDSVEKRSPKVSAKPKS